MPLFYYFSENEPEQDPGERGYAGSLVHCCSNQQPSPTAHSQHKHFLDCSVPGNWKFKNFNKQLENCIIPTFLLHLIVPLEIT